MKKNHAYGWSFTNLSLTKLLKIMKLTSILLFACAMSVNAGGFSQEVKVNLSLHGVKLTKIFKAIEKETKYRFTFCNDIIPEGRLFSVNVREKPVFQVMNDVMASTKLKYRFVEESGIFIISERTDNSFDGIKAPVLRTITGTVTNEQGEPLGDVSVQVKGANNATTTAANGTFSIRGRR